jgi:MFS family permease
MGILTSFGSFSRAVGPVVVAYLYGSFGPRVSFIVLACIVFIAITIICLTFKKYEPYKFS